MKYIIIARYGNVTHPELFSDETEAYDNHVRKPLNLFMGMNCGINEV